MVDYNNIDGTATETEIDDAATTGKYNLAGKGFLFGLGTEIDVDTAHDIKFNPGQCRNGADGGSMALAAALVKQIDVNWASGTAAGGFPSGLTLTADTWYHLFIIDETDLSIDAGFDSSLTATNLLTDSGGSFYRRVGSVLVDGSANIIGYTQFGDHFMWDTPPYDINGATQGTSATSRTLSTPLGVKVLSHISSSQSVAAGRAVLYISSLDADDDAAAADGSNFKATSLPDVASNPAIMGNSLIRTNTSSQIRTRSDIASTVLRIATWGWFDSRGSND